MDLGAVLCKLMSAATLANLASVATVVAAALAWVAIVRGNRQARDAARALAQERRFDFEIGLLLRLMEQSHDARLLNGEATLLALELLPSAGLSNVRAARGLPSNPEAIALFEDVKRRSDPPGFLSHTSVPSGGTYGDLLREEICEAVRARVDHGLTPEARQVRRITWSRSARGGSVGESNFRA